MIGTILVLGLAVTTILALLAAVLALGNLVPAATIASAIVSVNSYVAIFHSIWPLTTVALLSIIGTILSIEALIILPYKIAKWVYSKIPGIS
jgi:hypothetical protein